MRATLWALSLAMWHVALGALEMATLRQAFCYSAEQSKLVRTPLTVAPYAPPSPFFDDGPSSNIGFLLDGVSSPSPAQSTNTDSSPPTFLSSSIASSIDSSLSSKAMCPSSVHASPHNQTFSLPNHQPPCTIPPSFPLLASLSFDYLLTPSVCIEMTRVTTRLLAMVETPSLEAALLSGQLALMRGSVPRHAHDGDRDSSVTHKAYIQLKEAISATMTQRTKDGQDHRLDWEVKVLGHVVEEKGTGTGTVLEQTEGRQRLKVNSYAEREREMKGGGKAGAWWGGIGGGEEGDEEKGDIRGGWWGGGGDGTRGSGEQARTSKAPSGNKKQEGQGGCGGVQGVDEDPSCQGSAQGASESGVFDGVGAGHYEVAGVQGGLIDLRKLGLELLVGFRGGDVRSNDLSEWQGSELGARKRVQNRRGAEWPNSDDEEVDRRTGFREHDKRRLMRSQSWSPGGLVRKFDAVSASGRLLRPNRETSTPKTEWTAWQAGQGLRQGSVQASGQAGDIHGMVDACPGGHKLRLTRDEGGRSLGDEESSQCNKGGRDGEGAQVPKRLHSVWSDCAETDHSLVSEQMGERRAGEWGRISWFSAKNWVGAEPGCYTLGMCDFSLRDDPAMAPGGIVAFDRKASSPLASAPKAKSAGSSPSFSKAIFGGNGTLSKMPSKSDGKTKLITQRSFSPSCVDEKVKASRGDEGSNLEPLSPVPQKQGALATPFGHRRANSWEANGEGNDEKRLESALETEAILVFGLLSEELGHFDIAERAVAMAFEMCGEQASEGGRSGPSWVRNMLVFAAFWVRRGKFREARECLWRVVVVEVGRARWRDLQGSERRRLKGARDEGIVEERGTVTMSASPDNCVHNLPRTSPSSGTIPFTNVSVGTTTIVRTEPTTARESPSPVKNGVVGAAISASCHALSGGEHPADQHLEVQPLEPEYSGVQELRVQGPSVQERGLWDAMVQGLRVQGRRRRSKQRGKDEVEERYGLRHAMALLAAIHWLEGNVDGAISLLRKEIARDGKGEASPATSANLAGRDGVGSRDGGWTLFQADMAEALGKAYLEKGELDNAIDLHRLALSGRQASLGASFPGLARTLADLRDMEAARGNLKEAEGLCKQALPLVRHLSFSNSTFALLKERLTSPPPTM
eukprot:TRINITY_DN6679_c0_g1_i1.p1 TRINITY_DN6679_c0_g1~~TRINITY_DN6679_c0_g1_i1.p1  ORF type:complete len:1139 (+),score=154.96 TRINITY_DN6679_c0_g1_i1:103-3519(+)